MNEETLRKMELSKQRTDEMREVVLKLTDFLNHTGGASQRQSQYFYEALTSDHPTLQQSFWRMMSRVILLYANAPYDARNESSVQFCQFISQAVKDYDRGFPMI